MKVTWKIVTKAFLTRRRPNLGQKLLQAFPAFHLKKNIVEFQFTSSWFLYEYRQYSAYFVTQPSSNLILKIQVLWKDWVLQVRLMVNGPNVSGAQ